MEGDQQEMKEICPNGELNPFSKTASSQTEVQLVGFFFCLGHAQQVYINM